MHLVRDWKSVERASEVDGLAGWLLGIFGRVNLQWAQPRVQRKHMRVVEQLNLGGRRQLTLVSCDGERFLVGSGPDAVQTMTRVRPENAAGLVVLRGGGGDA